jgi:hypothetical protein
LLTGVDAVVVGAELDGVVTAWLVVEVEAGDAPPPAAATVVVDAAAAPVAPFAGPAPVDVGLACDVPPLASFGPAVPLCAPALAGSPGSLDEAEPAGVGPGAVEPGADELDAGVPEVAAFEPHAVRTATTHATTTSTHRPDRSTGTACHGSPSRRSGSHGPVGLALVGSGIRLT